MSGHLLRAREREREVSLVPLNPLCVHTDNDIRASSRPVGFVQSIRPVMRRVVQAAEEGLSG